MRERVRDLLAVGFLVGVVCLFFRETLFSGFSLVPTDVTAQLVAPFNHNVTNIAVHNHYTLDIVRQDYPWMMLAQESLRHHEVPLWNPWIFGGHPHVAGSMPAALSPFRVLALWCSAERTFSLGIILAFAAGALGMFGYLRELQCSRAAAVLGAVAFAFNSALVAWYWRVPFVMAWSPWVLWLHERSLSRASAAAAAGAGLLLGAAFLSGSIQAAIHVGFLCGGYMLGRIFTRPRGHRLPALRWAGLTLVVACAVAAVQWLPTLELLANESSGRASHPSAAKPGLTHTLLGLPLLITFVFPGLAGSTETFDILKIIQATLGDFTGYIGLTPFALALLGLSDRRRAHVRIFLSLGAGVLFIVFFTPLVKFTYHRLFVVLTFVSAALAAFGVDVVRTGDMAKIKRVLVLALSAVVCLLMALGLIQLIVHFWREPLLARAQEYVLSRASHTVYGAEQDWLRQRTVAFLDHYRITNVVFWLPAACLVAAAGAIWNYRNRAATRVLLAAVAALDLIVLGRLVLPQIDLRQYPLTPRHPLIEKIRADPSDFRVMQWSPQQRVFLPNNILLPYRLPTFSGYESLTTSNLAHLPWPTLAGIANVKYLLADEPLNLPQWELDSTAAGAWLYRNTQCRPRAQFYSEWKTQPDGAVTINPAAFVPAAITLVHSTPRTVTLELDSPQAGLLLLADTYYPGWHATLDNVRVPIHRANGVLRAVDVPAGRHRVMFSYTPWPFRLGMFLCLTALGVVGGLLVRAGLRYYLPRARTLETMASF